MEVLGILLAFTWVASSLFVGKMILKITEWPNE